MAKSLLPRAGGASASGKSSSGVGGQNVSEDWTRFGKRQILSIGSKKRHRYHDDDDDELLVDDVAAGGDNSSSDEEDQGRTSAVREKKRRAQPPSAAAASARANEVASADIAVSASAASKKKKKRGKKERTKESSAEMEPSTEEILTTDLSTNANTNDDVGEIDAVNRDEDPNIEVDASEKKKRWRKKVRSRQKNIRKDHRAAEDRPSHLVSGGRPLTKATRQKLGLQTTTTDKDSIIDSSYAISGAFDGGKWAGDGGETARTTKEQKSKTSARKTTLTKVGDCIVDRGIISERSDEGTMKLGVGEKPSDKKKGNNQKRKFKNLAVA